MTKMATLELELRLGSTTAFVPATAGWERAELTTDRTPLRYFQPDNLVESADTATAVLPYVVPGQLIDHDVVEGLWLTPNWWMDWTASLLADELERATSLDAKASRARRHPAFGALRRLGIVGVAVAFQRLVGEHRPLWLTFLKDTVADGPADDVTSIDAAAAAWRDWGQLHGYLA